MQDKVIVISRSGHEMTLQEWQKLYGLGIGSNNIGEYFSLDEKEFQDNIRDYGKLVVNELLIKVLDRFRMHVKTPITINAFNRDEAKQAQLRKDGFRAATVSPHVAFMAADVDTKTYKQTEQWAKIMQDVGKELEIKIRVGFRQYLDGPNKPSTFIHVDVCPEFFGSKKPYANKPHPVVWEKQITW